MTADTIEYASDAGNEQVIIAAALVDVEPWAIRQKLVRHFPTPDYFLTPEHAAGWDLVLELHRRGLDFDGATAKRLAPNVDVKLLTELVDARPDVPSNLDYHVGELLWDRAKATALQGPINALLEHLRDPKADRARVVALAEQVRSSLGTGATSYVRDPSELHREVMANLDRRFAGQVLYHFGVPGLDWFDTLENAEDAGIDIEGIPTEDVARAHGFTTSQAPRIMPGAAPKQATVITAISGSGKTSFVGEMVLGLARQGRRVLVASWEVGSLLTMEALTEFSLCREDPTFSRSRMMQGRGDWEQMRDRFDKRMRKIGKYVRVMDNPFYLINHAKGKPSNEHHLDVFGAAIAESGCDVVVADLWSRMLVDKTPSAEESALFRQHAHIEQLNVHLVVVTQQTHKKILESPSKMPTIEGIKGSGGYFEFADACYGLHRPARWKKVPDTRIEVIGFKQKHWVGNWAVSLNFNPKTGLLGAGWSIPYDPGLTNDEGSVDAFLDGPKGGKKGRR